MDVSDLPLFANLPAAEPPPPSAAVPLQPAQEKAALEPKPTAELIPFPPCADVQLVADLAAIFIDLRSRHGRRCRSMLLAKRFRPIRTRLKRLGVAAAVIDQELAQLEAAVARVVWIHDGCPNCGSESGGGSAA